MFGCVSLPIPNYLLLPNIVNFFFYFANYAFIRVSIVPILFIRKKTCH
jgi:hypothetical protein